MVLTLNGQGEIAFANPQDHYRLRAEWALFLLFAALLLFYGRWTGAKALLSFVFTALAIWKILVPMFLKGYDPVMVALIVITILTIAIVLLVGGWNRRGAVACLGAFAGILTPAFWPGSSPMPSNCMARSGRSRKRSSTADTPIWT